MGEWKGPVKYTFRNIYLAIGVTILLMVISLFFIGTVLDYIISAAVLFMLFVYLPYFIFITLRLPRVRDHLFSRWDLDKDLVATRIHQAIQMRGINVAVGYKGEAVIFPLAPLSIVVAPELKRTMVYVGPLMEGNDDQVEGLTGFVDAALGKRA